MSTDTLMTRSISQGVEFLRAAPSGDPVVFKLSQGAWNFATSQSPAAKELEAAIGRDVGHSGASFGYALKSVISEAVKLGYAVEAVERPTAQRGHRDTVVTLTLRP